MANRLNSVEEARRRIRRELLTAGADLREARLAAGLTQTEVASALGWSKAKVGRIERGDDLEVSARSIAQAAAVVGLALSLRLFPGRGRLRDAAQLEMQGRFLPAIQPGGWSVLLEETIQLPGDLRAFDVMLRGPVSIGVEFITRLRDMQAQVRAAMQKQRDSHAHRVILVIRATHANRRAVQEATAVLGATFPVRTRAVMAALAEGRDPGGNAIVFF